MSSFAIPLYLSLPVKSKQKYSARRRNEKKPNYRYTFVTFCRLAVILNRVQNGAGQFPEYIANFIVQNSKKTLYSMEFTALKKGLCRCTGPCFLFIFRKDVCLFSRPIEQIRIQLAGDLIEQQRDHHGTGKTERQKLQRLDSKA